MNIDQSKDNQNSLKNIDEKIFKELETELITTSLEGSVQLRFLITCNIGKSLVKICMYKEDNHKLPHIHVSYKDEGDISVCIDSGRILAGKMKGKLLKKVLAWVGRHKESLLNCWEQIQSGQAPELNWVS